MRDFLRNLTLIFIRDFYRDVYETFEMFKEEDPSGLENRANQIKLPLEIAKKIRDTKSFEVVKKDIEEFTSKLYVERADAIKDSIRNNQEQWDEIISDFSKSVIEITQHPWCYNNYFCVISPVHFGASDWKGNKIVISCDLEGDMKSRITAHELVLSNIFQIVRKYYTEYMLSDWKVWAIAEITTVIILDNKTMLNFWRSFNPPETYFSNSNYPQLVGLERKFKSFYSSTPIFYEYIKLCVECLMDIEESKIKIFPG